MYTVSKEFHFSASHQLNLPYESKCNSLHGHNYIVELVLRSPSLDENSILVDYNEMKPFQEYIDDYLDHRHLNDILTGPATAENLAKHLYMIAWKLWNHVAITVRVSETPKTWASYSES